MQQLLLNQNHPQETPKPVQNQVDTNILLHELIQKKTQIDHLQKENNHLAENYVKIKGNFNDSRPARVLEQMVKDKNEVYDLFNFKKRK